MAPMMDCKVHQRGAALLMAMMIVALIATLATAMVWQQWRAVQVEAAERSRAQSTWILNGALDWARLILMEDSPTIDSLDEPWAVPLAEARLSTFLAANKDNTDDGPEAFLSGQITDAQARFNLTNLVDAHPGEGKPMQVSKTHVAIFGRLCDFLGVSGEVANRVALGMLSGQAALAASEPVGNAVLLPQSVQQLKWFGLDDETLKRLAPFIVILPVPTTVNANTAPREVIAAAIGSDLGTAERIVQTRQRAPFKNIGDVGRQTGSPPPQNIIGVQSSYFEVRGRLRLSDKVLEESSIIWRRDRRETVPLNLRRETSREGP